MRYKKNENVASAQLDNEICIFDPDEGSYLSLNETASEIWQMLVEPLEINEIMKKLTDIYEIDYQICHKDVISFLKKAKESNMIEEFEKTK